MGWEYILMLVPFAIALTIFCEQQEARHQEILGALTEEADDNYHWSDDRS